VAFISYWFDKPWFLLRENLLLYSSYLPLGVPNGRVLYRHKELPSTPAATSKQDKCNEMMVIFGFVYLQVKKVFFVFSK
jgi:hypothetical protein